MDQTPQGFASEDEEATYCLSLLRDGDRHQQIVARERLSQIFERRGLLDEAAQCLETNIREGVRDPRVYQRLAGFYRRQGRHELADEVLVEARRLAERMQRPPPPGRVGRPGARSAAAARRPRRPAAAKCRGAPDRAALRRTPPPGPARRRPQTPVGELELDRVPARLRRRRRSARRAGGRARPPVDRPWWLSPAMLVLLILLCGPYGLALMWVRGGYTKQAKVRATVVWAGLIVLMLAGSGRHPPEPDGRADRRFGRPGRRAAGGRAADADRFRHASAPSGVPKATLPPGLAAAPPTPIASPARSAHRRLASSSRRRRRARRATTKRSRARRKKRTRTRHGRAASPTLARRPERPRRPQAGRRAGQGRGNRRHRRQHARAPRRRPAGGQDGARRARCCRSSATDQQMDGKAWKNVRDDTGSTGWIAAELLEPA